MKGFSQEYRDFIQSTEWKKIRRQKLDADKWVCQRCGEFANNVHHKSYARPFGEEEPGDLESLCQDCHDTHHRVDPFAKLTNKKGKRALNAMAVLGYLTEAQKAKLQRAYGKPVACMADLGATGREFRDECMKYLGLNKIYGIQAINHDGDVVNCAQMLGGQHWETCVLRKKKAQKEWSPNYMAFKRHEAAAFVARNSRDGHTVELLATLGVPNPAPSGWLERFKKCLTRSFVLSKTEIKFAKEQYWYPAKLGGLAREEPPAWNPQ